MKKTICQLALLLTVVSLAGCGLKGPLYFPKDEQPKSQVTQPTQTTLSTTPSTNAGQTPASGVTSVQPAQ